LKWFFESNDKPLGAAPSDYKHPALHETSPSSGQAESRETDKETGKQGETDRWIKAREVDKILLMCLRAACDL